MRRGRFIAHGVLALDAASWGLDFPVAEPAVERAPFKEVGAFAVVEITGPLMQRSPPGVHCCWDTYEAIRARVDAALESGTSGLVLRLDSPGGEVAGCFELAEEIRAKAAAKGKAVIAYVDGMAASAAYALACAADRICVPPTGIVGSVGCIKVAVDQTRMDRAMGLAFTVASSGKRKADGNPHVPTTEETLAAMQAEVDAMAAVFFELVGRTRGLAPTKVAELEAALFLGAAAVEVGLADEVTTFEGLLAKSASGTKTNARTGAEADMDEKEKAIAALKALAESKDEAESKAAKAALKAMGVAEGEEDDKPKDDDKEKTESKAEGEQGDKPKDDDKEKTESKASAAASGDPALALAAKVQSLEAWKNHREESEERAKLMATRPDFAPEVVALMNRSPLPVVRDAVKNLPRGAAKASGQVAAARAAISVQPTVGENAGEPTSALPDDQAHELDVQMGLARRTNAIRHEGNRMILGVMTPADARAELAKKGAAR